MRIDLRRWGLFNLVGAGGFVTQIAALSMLSRWAGLPVVAATALALELAALQNFAAHSRWTWNDRRPASMRGWLSRFGRFQAAKATSLVSNLALTAILVDAGLQVEVANTAAVLVCALPNYFLSDRIVFS